LKVITAQEALDGYAKYAVVDRDGRTFGLYRDLDRAEYLVLVLNRREDDGPRFEVAVIAS
jgi:hypothetical protein